MKFFERNQAANSENEKQNVRNIWIPINTDKIQYKKNAINFNYRVWRQDYHGHMNHKKDQWKTKKREQYKTIELKTF